MTARAFSALGAAERAAALFDEGTFRTLFGPKGQSLLLGRGRIDGRLVLAAFTDGAVRGGTFGKHEAGLLARLVEKVDRQLKDQPCLIIGFDTGGVRIQEGPAALAALSAVAVSLARLTLHGVRALSLISGKRGCFGAPSVMAALPGRVVMTADCNWGLTGPSIIGGVRSEPEQGERSGFAATSSASRKRNGDVHAVVADDVDSVRAELRRFVGSPLPKVSPLADHIAAGAKLTRQLQVRLRRSRAYRAPARVQRRRDLLRYSFRGQWKPSGPLERSGLVEAAFGTLAGRSALSLIIGPERIEGSGVGIEEAALVTAMVRRAGRMPGEKPVILVFLFCQGHVVDVTQERFGLPRALAACLRTMVAARLRGHPIITVLGGGTYGAAYLALAAPSHRILAMRGTSIAPMAPEVLRAFQTLRGPKAGQEPEAQLAELVPDIRIVESVIRLPRALRDEIAGLGREV
jgi:malonate decarboxylase beta subunit